ncbi:hypothetical protein [Leptolyngbya sp. NK1-12]|uniref:hypothetical protein n=1 Tax=Leptolyngbya sp. NK1-12 TaxID=2547451 RepID=UPI003B641474
MVELLLKHDEKLKAWQPESSQIRALRQWTEVRRMLVGERVRLTNGSQPLSKTTILKYWIGSRIKIRKSSAYLWNTILHSKQRKLPHQSN